MSGAGAVLLTVVILVVLAIAISSGGFKTAFPGRACPPGTFLALDGFCTHIYATPTPPDEPSER